MIKLEKMKLSTAIYLTTIIALLLLQLALGGMTTKNTMYILIITTLPYIVFTKKYYIITPVISIFFLLGTIASLPIAVYTATGNEPSFIISSAALGFFITLFIGNMVSHAERSIRSPWVANIFGLIALYIMEFALLTALSTKSAMLIGGLGLLAHLLIATIYLTVGKYISINTPAILTEDSLVSALTAELTNSVYNSTSELEGSSGQFKLSGKSSSFGRIRLYPTLEKITTTTENKNFLKNFYLWENGKKKSIYSWLLQETIRSSEINKTKEFKSEQFIVIQKNPTSKDGSFDIIELPIKRSSKKLYFGVFTLGEKVNKKTIKKFNELAIELKLKSEGF